jgi:hypothetical protein
LRDDQASINRLAEPHLIRQDASPFRNTLQCEDHGIDLVGVGIDAPLPLGSGVPLLFVSTAVAD